MLTLQSGSVRYLKFQKLDQSQVKHAIFTRQGGFSPPPWESLNMGGTAGDDPQRVKLNRELAFSTLGIDPDATYDVWQVHGDEVVCTDMPRDPRQPHQKADAILTDQPGITLFMRFADCVPILYHDPVRRVVGMAHAGWKGSVSGIASRTVKIMQERYGSQPENIRTYIGPSIGPDHYIIGPEVVAQVKAAFGKQAAGLLKGGSEAVTFDLWSANRLWLEKAGIKDIESAALCTACQVGDWFSHRAEHGKTGRFGVMIALQG